METKSSAERPAPSAAPAGNGETPETGPSNFLRNIILEDLRTGRHQGRVATRFPPEPNGYLHIGHAKSICLNFGLAREFGGTCNLRFDDTNPETEDPEYVESMQRDIRWLGFEWDGLYFASDYYQQMYDYAVQLIKEGKAYVCSLTEEEVRQYRGTVNEPGKPSPYRSRSVEENLDLFERMAKGEFPEGAHTLRAVGDMSAANMKMRDPMLYRIRHEPHFRTGDKWHVYPMYDYAHPLEDVIERITHSICTLEFENNRDIYDWVTENCHIQDPPRQYEFARLELNYTMTSKRKLLALVRDKEVRGWDDPRMPTLAGLRRRGVTPEAIRDLCDRIGVARANSVVDLALLEKCIRDDLHTKAPRVMAVLQPLKVVIENYPEGQVEELDAPYFPPDVPAGGSRLVPFSRELYIERDDFLEDPPKDYYRLAPGREVRLRYAYYLTCTGVVKDDAGNVIEVRCTYDPETKGGSSPDGRKVRGTIHWVSAAHAVTAEVRLYDRLFKAEDPGAAEDFKACLNPESLVVVPDARLEPSVAKAEPGSRFQFERQGFFFLDPIDSVDGKLFFNRTVTLKDSWAGKAAEAGAKGEAGAKAEPKKGAASKEPKGQPKPQAVKAEAPVRTLEQQAKVAHYRESAGLPEADAGILADDPALAAFFDAAVAGHANPKGVANWIIHELKSELKDRSIDQLPFAPRDLAELVTLIDEKTISSAIGKSVFADMLAGGGSPKAIVEQKGLKQVTDAGAIEPVVDRVIAANPEQAARYREGKGNMLGFFVGQVMKETGGKANPQLVTELVRKKL